MNQRLFPNIKKLTSFFGLGMLIITVLTLTLRLTLLQGMAVVPAASVVDMGGNDEDDGVFYQINTAIYFSSPDAKGDVRITNPEANECYMRVDIRRNDTGKSLYYSGDITPGTSIQSARLQGDPPEEGVYECTATISVYDIQTRDKIGSQEEDVTVYIGVKPEKK